MLDDADRLVHAVDADSPWNHAAASWWEATLNGERRVAIPWQTIGVFVPISTHPRVAAHPLGGGRCVR